ncbi:hypothetical protein [Geoglobus ahangari]|nr:hypothetical protein [Geoglobus ahangari]
MIAEILFAGGLISAIILAVVSIGGIIKAVSNLFRTRKDKSPMVSESGA